MTYSSPPVSHYVLHGCAEQHNYNCILSFFNSEEMQESKIHIETSTVYSTQSVPWRLMIWRRNGLWKQRSRYMPYSDGLFQPKHRMTHSVMSYIIDLGKQRSRYMPYSDGLFQPKHRMTHSVMSYIIDLFCATGLSWTEMSQIGRHLNKHKRTSRLYYIWYILYI